MTLKDRDELMFVNRGPSISVRLVVSTHFAWILDDLKKHD